VRKLRGNGGSHYFPSHWYRSPGRRTRYMLYNQYIRYLSMTSYVVEDDVAAFYKSCCYCDNSSEKMLPGPGSSSM